MRKILGFCILFGVLVLGLYKMTEVFGFETTLNGLVFGVSFAALISLGVWLILSDDVDLPENGE